MSRWLAAMRADLRQRHHRRAFRIGPPVLDERLRARLDRLLAEVAKPAAPDREPADELDHKAVVDAVTALWRAQRKLAQDGERMTRYAVQADRYLTTCRDELAKAEIVVQGHDGDPYHPGRALDVQDYQDSPDVDVETVLLTARPSVYIRGRLVQMGQVIVGRPVGAQPPASVPTE